MKLLRSVTPGIYPGVEVSEFLSNRHHFDHVPPYAGSLEYKRESSSESITLGVLHGYVPNEGDAWHATRDELSHYLQRMHSSKYSLSELQKSAPTKFDDLEFATAEPPAIAQDSVGQYLSFAELMGKRIAELHIALTSDASDPAFAPEPFNDFYRQSLYNGNIALTTRRLEHVRQRVSEMRPDVRALATMVVEEEQRIIQKFRALYAERVDSQRIRFHGRMHLGHLLVRDKDVIIFDLGGDPYLHISERRIKRCPLRDVVSMLMSFGYAAQSSIRQRYSPEGHETVDRKTMRVWGRFWYAHVSAAFLRSYWRTAARTDYMPKSREHQQILLDNYLLERALLDVRDDINQNPDLSGMPFRVILHLLDAEAEQRIE
jgi:maltose alpha-D-glucosyltransferase/alpha-amylase